MRISLIGSVLDIVGQCFDRIGAVVIIDVNGIDLAVRMEGIECGEIRRRGVGKTDYSRDSNKLLHFYLII